MQERTKLLCRLIVGEMMCTKLRSGGGGEGVDLNVTREECSIDGQVVRVREGAKHEAAGCCRWWWNMRTCDGSHTGTLLGV